MVFCILPPEEIPVNKYISLLVIFAIIITVFCACSKKKAESVTDNQSTEASSVAVSGSTEPVGNSDSVIIETSYGNLSYPVAFEEIINYEKSDSDDAELYSFYAVLEDREIKVYDIIFSEKKPESEKYLIGTVSDDSDNPVFVSFEPVAEIIDEDMDEDDEEIVYSAQETVNDVIDSIKLIPGFKD